MFATGGDDPSYDKKNVALMQHDAQHFGKPAFLKLPRRLELNDITNVYLDLHHALIADTLLPINPDCPVANPIRNPLKKLDRRAGLQSPNAFL